MLKLVVCEISSPYSHFKVRNKSLRFLLPRTGPQTVLVQNIQKTFFLVFRIVRPVFIEHLFLAKKTSIENRLTYFLGLQVNSFFVKACVLDSLRSIINSESGEFKTPVGRDTEFANAGHYFGI